jgi:hypothetical protein
MFKIGWNTRVPVSRFYAHCKLQTARCPTQNCESDRSNGALGKMAGLASATGERRFEVSRDNLDENGGGNQSLKRRPVAKV